MPRTRSPAARGFTLVEILIVIGVIAILAGVAIPWLLQARIAANEASAIASLSAINSAQAAYRIACGGGRFYAPTLTALGTPHPVTGEAFISPDLALGDQVAKSGYLIRMAGIPPADAVGARPTCTGAEPAAGYAAAADPLRPGWSGRRYFATNTSRAIYEHTESLADRMPGDGPPPAGREVR
ncbi:MAG TPA: type II secretion system protein [Vicinamibacterales bacterium]|nr:type II secretion system protein [Vicinamibacterales bacterium]